MIASVFNTACLIGTTFLVKPAHVVAKPMLTPVAWGADNRGGDTTFNNNEDMTGVVQVSCVRQACAGLKPDGSVVSWGLSCCGGDTQGKDVSGMAQVVCGGEACAGLKTDGSVVHVWHGSSRMC